MAGKVSGGERLILGHQWRMDQLLLGRTLIFLFFFFFFFSLSSHWVTSQAVRLELKLLEDLFGAGGAGASTGVDAVCISIIKPVFSLRRAMEELPGLLRGCFVGVPFASGGEASRPLIYQGNFCTRRRINLCFVGRTVP